MPSVLLHPGRLNWDLIVFIFDDEKSTHHAFIMLKRIRTTGGLCMFRNLIKMQEQSEDANTNMLDKAETHGSQ